MATGVEELIEELNEDGSVLDIANNVRTQFSLPTGPLLGAEFMPEERVRANKYTGGQLVQMAGEAQDLARHARVPYDRAFAVAKYEVALHDIGHGTDMDEADHDDLLDVLGLDVSMADAATLLNLVLNGVTIPIVVKEERNRWQVFTRRVHQRRANRDQAEDIPHPNPAGAVAQVALDWADPNADALDDMFARNDWLGGTSRIVMPTPMLNRFLGNAAVQRAVNSIVVVNNGQLVTQSQRTNLAEVNNYLSANGLPPIETYDRQHNGRRFLPANVAVFFGNTGQARAVDLPQTATAEAAQEVLPNTVGRYAIGRVGGHRASDPARIAKLIAKLEEMPYFVKAEGKTTSGPEVTAPRGFTSLVL